LGHRISEEEAFADNFLTTLAVLLAILFEQSSQLQSIALEVLELSARAGSPDTLQQLLARVSERLINLDALLKSASTFDVFFQFVLYLFEVGLGVVEWIQLLTVFLTEGWNQSDAVYSFVDVSAPIEALKTLLLRFPRSIPSLFNPDLFLKFSRNSTNWGKFMTLLTAILTDGKESEGMGIAFFLRQFAEFSWS
jgi:hypothetical protein